MSIYEASQVEAPLYIYVCIYTHYMYIPGSRLTGSRALDTIIVVVAHTVAGEREIPWRLLTCYFLELQFPSLILNRIRRVECIWGASKEALYSFIVLTFIARPVFEKVDLYWRGVWGKKFSRSI